VEFRSLGATGLKVSVLGFGTMSFAGNDRQSVVGTTDGAEARRLVDRCLDAGVRDSRYRRLTLQMRGRGSCDRLAGMPAHKPEDMVPTFQAAFNSGTGPDGSAVSMSGDTSEVIRKQSDGTWRYVIDDPFSLP
jgi:hypothetical protein